MHYFQTNQQEDTDAPASNLRKTKRYYREENPNSKKQKATKSASGPPSTEDLRASLRQVRKIIFFSHRVIGVIPGRFEGFGGEKYRKQHKNN